MNCQAELMSSKTPATWSELLSDERLTAVREERRRFSNELHDVVSNHLNCATLLLTTARQSLPAGTARDLIDAAEKNVRGCWNDARRCAAGLRACSLESHDLASSLSDFAAALSAAAGIPVTFATSGAAVPLSEETNLAFLRVAQEAATNAIRHAHAGWVSVELGFGPDGAGIKVSDDGAGFDASCTPGGMGLSTMRDRARRIGAQLAILSRPRHGTQIVLTLPAEALAPQEPETYLG
jgi:signal transduction histidine kinase